MWSKSKEKGPIVICLIIIAAIGTLDIGRILNSYAFIANMKIPDMVYNWSLVIIVALILRFFMKKTKQNK